jgi:hypothetical protein
LPAGRRFHTIGRIGRIGRIERIEPIERIKRIDLTEAADPIDRIHASGPNEIGQTERATRAQRVQVKADEEVARRRVMDQRATRQGNSDRVAPDALRDEFLGWQCRLRQLAVRQDGGRPSQGMKPRVGPDLGKQAEAEDISTLDPLVVLIVEREPEHATAHLRHLCRRSNDPKDRYDRVLSVLRAGYYQYPNRFSDAMTALFSSGSQRAAALRGRGSCVLHFDQYSQAYRIPCSVRSLANTNAAYQATFWHNAVFNPALPPHSEVLAFTPDWSRAQGWRAEAPG